MGKTLQLLGDWESPANTSVLLFHICIDFFMGAGVGGGGWCGELHSSRIFGVLTLENVSYEKGAGTTRMAALFMRGAFTLAN